MVSLKEPEVGIIGAGPAGLVTALRLQQEGIPCVVFEKHTPSSIQSVARAGLLQFGAVNYLNSVGLLPEGMVRDGSSHGSFVIRYGFPVPQDVAIDYSDRPHTVYPQSRFTIDLIEMFLQRGGDIRFGAEVLGVDGSREGSPKIKTADGEAGFDYVVGADGPKSRVRESLLNQGLTTSTETYPFHWYTIGFNAEPSTKRLIYSAYPDGLALLTVRTQQEQRCHMQYWPETDAIEDWTEKELFDKLDLRLGFKLKRGEIFSRSPINMESVLCDAMTVGNVMLIGDAAHTFSPAGAVGWSAAIGDAAFAAAALIQAINHNDRSLYQTFSEKRLPQIGRIVRQSNDLLRLFDIPIPGSSGFDEGMRQRLGVFNSLATSARDRSEFGRRYSGEDIDPKTI